MRPRPEGVYVSRAWIPGNYLAEGTLFVTAGINSVEPSLNEFIFRDAVAFQVMDSLDGDSARGDWGGRMGGVVRPMLNWETSYTAPTMKSAAIV